MIRKILLVVTALFFIISPSTLAETTKDVELFDIQNERVTKTMPNSLFFQKEAAKYIRGIESVYVKASPIPKTGYMIKIPLKPELLVKNKWMNDPVNKVILIYPPHEKPVLLVFDKKRQIHIFNFKGNAESLLKMFKVE